MVKKIKNKAIFALICSLIIVLNLPVINSSRVDYYSGFDKGPSYTSVVPIEKVTFVNYDEESYLDDYAYLASVPTAVFKDDGKLFSHPLLFYQDKMDYDEDKYRSLDAYPGIENFMEDWMGYCNQQLDQMTLINLPKSKLHEDWDADEIISIDSDDPFELASKIALLDWSYSDNAVIAVIDEEFEKPKEIFKGKIEGELIVDKKIKTEIFQIEQTNKLNPQFREFEVPNGYKYITAKTTFACIEYMVMPFSWIVIPAGDKDMQLFCKYDDNWMQVAACSTNTNQWGMDSPAERAHSYVYKNGPWRIGVSDVPTESVEKHGTWQEIISNLINGVVYNSEVTMYPGTVIDFPENPPFECSEVDIKLTWNNPSAKLGFSIIGPGGEEVLSAINDSRIDSQELHLDELGQCLENEKYSICVFSMNDLSKPIDFEIEYSWKQRIFEKEANALASATEGAVLASQLNAPLLYITEDSIPEITEDVLYKLGVKNIYLVNVGEKLNSKNIDELKKIASIKKHYQNLEKIYQDIMEKTNQNDVIFSTIDSRSYEYVNDHKVQGEQEKALHIGPAAYCAAHHGSPVLIVDMHPELSSAIVWHNEFWKRHSIDRVDFEPSVAEMHLTAKRAYNFLKKNNYDKSGMETLITVASQYDIGMPWDRAFPGKAKPGRILGTPVDSSVQISRSMLYPALIFENPALDSNGVKLINGSKSIRKFPFWGPLGLKIIREPGEEIFKNPILHTYTCYMHRFNERASKYYDFKYQTADEKIPGETNSFEPIDDGVNAIFGGEEGAFYPDMAVSEITPFYAQKGGYSNAFSTSFDAVMHNLNQGAILWIRGGHGTHSGGGGTSFWNPIDEKKGFSSPIAKYLIGAIKEENPWRGYEWYLGSTENPDTMTMEVHGIIPALLGNPDIDGLFRTGVDWGPAKKPFLDFVSKILNRPILDFITPRLDWLKDEYDYYDGYVQSVMLSTKGYPKYHGYDVDDALENIYSCGVMMSDCQPAGTFYHLSLIRHGSSFQIIDPWPTTWYAGVWTQSIPRDLALGDTIGEAYTKGISKVGILYISEPPQWWWDSGENVCFFGDPDLRVYVPGTHYSDKNYWTREDVKSLPYDEKHSFNGHMPFGATEYPHEKEPKTLFEEYLPLIIIILIISIIALIAKKKKKI